MNITHNCIIGQPRFILLFSEIIQTGESTTVRIIRVTVFGVLVAMALVLASGRLLNNQLNSENLTSLLIAIGFLLLSAALAVFMQRKTKKSSDRFLVFCVCIGIMTTVQLTGGSSSFFYSVYLLFLMWVSLSSTAGGATELGLLIGFTEASALLNASIWSGESSLLARLIPLLLPALKALLVPFLFSLAADWMTDRKSFPNEADLIRKSKNGKSAGEKSTVIKPKLSYPLLTIIHTNAEADSTCFFIKHNRNFYRLEEFIAEDDSVISKYMLPENHRLLRMLKNSDKPVVIKVGSREELCELAPYRLAAAETGIPFWIVICSLGNIDNPAGFLLQDFRAGNPSSKIIQNLEYAADTFHIDDMPDRNTFSSGEDSVWLAKLVSATGEDSLDKSVQGITVLLSEILPDSTISIADVNLENKTIRVWISRGPLARWRRRRVFSVSEGIAGWIVKNRVPCRRSRIKHGEKNVSSFSNEEHLPLKVGSCMGVPVLRNNDVIALIIAEHADDQAFDKYHESILLAAAGLFSMTEELADLRNRFQKISGRDTLTELPGIALFNRHLHQMAKRVEEYAWSVGVIVADIDKFNSINRNLGYTEGDRILKEVAARFSNCFSEEIIISRIGPDSFAACIPKAGIAEMEALSQRVADALSWEYISRSSGARLSITASIGGCFTYINRKVLILTDEAERIALKASETGPGTCLIHKLGLSESGKR